MPVLTTTVHSVTLIFQVALPIHASRSAQLQYGLCNICASVVKLHGNMRGTAPSPPPMIKNEEAFVAVVGQF